MLVGCLEFNEEKRNSVHEADQIGPLSAVLTRNPELGYEEEIVVGRMLPVDDLYRFDSFVVVRGPESNLDAVLQ
jgi:hypothetical protein